MGFIDTMRAQGHAVESICRVLREQGCQIAARTYRAWKRVHQWLGEHLPVTKMAGGRTVIPFTPRNTA